LVGGLFQTIPYNNIKVEVTGKVVVNGDPNQQVNQLRAYLRGVLQDELTALRQMAGH
jgi:hypothetical protein